jgi:molybdenum cofactor biosynthesis protein B
VKHHSSHHAHDATAVACGVITVSDTRTEENDTSGQRIRRLLSEHGHQADWYRIVKDDPDGITDVIRSAPAAVPVLICNGGTGITRRDSTYEAIARLLDKEITGFGELFRMLSFAEIGAAESSCMRTKLST